MPTDDHTTLRSDGHHEMAACSRVRMTLHFCFPNMKMRPSAWPLTLRRPVQARVQHGLTVNSCAALATRFDRILSEKCHVLRVLLWL